MVYEKVALKLDVSSAHEEEFLSNFCREYNTHKQESDTGKSFMQRMKDDIGRRRNKQTSLKNATKTYRRSKYGVVSREKVHHKH